MGQLLDPNHASLLKVAAAGGQPSGYSLEDPMLSFLSCLSYVYNWLFDVIDIWTLFLQANAAWYTWGYFRESSASAESQSATFWVDTGKYILTWFIFFVKLLFFLHLCPICWSGDKKWDDEPQSCWSRRIIDRHSWFDWFSS